MVDILTILKEIGNFGGVAVSALAMILVIMAIQNGIITKEGIKSLSDIKPIPKDSVAEIKEILNMMATSISGPGGLKDNDLSHIQAAIDNLGREQRELCLEMNDFNKNFEKHDRQAWEIKEAVKEINKKLQAQNQII